jgi:hypothetical protein
MADDSITLGTILTHIQALAGRTHMIEAQAERLFAEIQNAETRVSQRLENRFNFLTAQIDAIDKRLDRIEIEMLPKRVLTLEGAVFGGPRKGHVS